MTNATEMLTALGDPTRQAILDRLSHGPLAVGQLGLVFDTQDGTRRLYQVDPEGIALLRRHLDGFWERSLAAFQQRARYEKGEQHDRNR